MCLHLLAVTSRSFFHFTGYIGDEEATANILDSEGWLRTGDLCYIDSEGFLFYVDRIKEMIKYRGYQVGLETLFMRFYFINNYECMFVLH